MPEFANIPMRRVGPIKIQSPEFSGEIFAPLATYETPLWPSVDRGARISMHGPGINAVVTNERMSRSIAIEAPDALDAHSVISAIKQRQSDIQKVVSKTSRFAKLIDIQAEQVGRIIYLRFEFTTGDAAGHNMVTLACDHIQQWALAQYPQCHYISVSANYCTDKKVSAINSIRGRGKSITAEMLIPRKLCIRFLKVTPEAIVNVHVKKNLIGSTLAGSICSANAHYANMLLAFYLATGQDAANIVEGSQGITHAELQDGDLYFSVNLPNIVVGTVGNGKEFDFVQENLAHMGCCEDSDSGQNSRRLAIIAASVVWCGELSLMGALTNPGELMKSHLEIERERS